MTPLSSPLRKTYGLNYLLCLLRLPRLFAIDGFLSRAEALALYRFAKQVPHSGHILEIGSWKGKSAYCLGRGAKPGTFLTLVDPLDGSGEKESEPVYRAKQPVSLEQTLWDNLKNLTKKVNLKIIRGTSSDVFLPPASLDLLFLDGDHSEEAVFKDFHNLSSFLKNESLFLIHDTAPWSPAPGPRRLAEFLRTTGQITVLAQIDALLVARYHISPLTTKLCGSAR